MLSYNCTDTLFTLQNDVFTVDPTELVITITKLDESCGGTSGEFTFQSGLTMDYLEESKSVTLDSTDIINGDGIYYFTYEYDSVTYNVCTFVFCTTKCDVYNAIYDNLNAGCATCTSDLDKAYNIFMTTSIISSLANCEQCCKARETYSILLSLLSNCTTC